MTITSYNKNCRKAAMSKPFQLIADHPALDFANTLDYRYEPSKSIEMLESVEDLLEFESQSGLLTATEARAIGRKLHKQSAGKLLDSARELREVIERIFVAAADGRPVAKSDLDVLNARLEEASANRGIERRNNCFVWRWQEAARSGDGLLWRVAQSATELLTSPEIRFVRRCGAENCRWLFLDRSKNHSRRWCDMKICGNREKARAYYHRTTVESQD